LFISLFAEVSVMIETNQSSPTVHPLP